MKIVPAHPQKQPVAVVAPSHGLTKARSTNWQGASIALCGLTRVSTRSQKKTSGGN